MHPNVSAAVANICAPSYHLVDPYCRPWTTHSTIAIVPPSPVRLIHHIPTLSGQRGQHVDENHWSSKSLHLLEQITTPLLFEQITTPLPLEQITTPLQQLRYLWTGAVPSFWFSTASAAGVYLNAVSSTTSWAPRTTSPHCSPQVSDIFFVARSGKSLVASEHALPVSTSSSLAPASVSQPQVHKVCDNEAYKNLESKTPIKDGSFVTVTAVRRASGGRGRRVM
ncbi:hypothetical protein PENSPDRAFT_662396 [Peniophora sp. CONT]|nr:hypothetical protein PENSPDRAFT_662396 [Peniophora sp. CONT]